LIEKRKFQRVLAFSTIRLFTAKREVVFDGDLLDISKGGICVANVDRQQLESFSAGQEFKFELMIGTAEVTGVALIAWMDAEKLCMGLEFAEIFNDEERTSLEELINSGF
jgi:hypothetical protein